MQKAKAWCSGQVPDGHCEIRREYGPATDHGSAAFVSRCKLALAKRSASPLQARARRYRHGWRVCGKCRSNFPPCRATPIWHLPFKHPASLLNKGRIAPIYLIFITYLNENSSRLRGDAGRKAFLGPCAAGAGNCSCISCNTAIPGGHAAPEPTGMYSRRVQERPSCLHPPSVAPDYLRSSPN